jgi:hypothetical protein
MKSYICRKWAGAYMCLDTDIISMSHIAYLLSFG